MYAVLTDNEQPLTGRCGQRPRPSFGHHAFDKLCRGPVIGEPLTISRRAQSGGLVERFNGCLRGWLPRLWLELAQGPKKTRRRCSRLNNTQDSQRVVGHTAALRVFEPWRRQRSQLYPRAARGLEGLERFLQPGLGIFGVRYP